MKLTICNWKNHEKTTVPLTGVTMISGRNGSGKTGILEALEFLATQDLYEARRRRAELKGNDHIGAMMRSGQKNGLLKLEGGGFLVSVGIALVSGRTSLSWDCYPDGGENTSTGKANRIARTLGRNGALAQIHAFTGMNAKERRDFIMRAAGAGASKEQVLALVKQHAGDGSGKMADQIFTVWPEGAPVSGGLSRVQNAAAEMLKQLNARERDLEGAVAVTEGEAVIGNRSELTAKRDELAQKIEETRKAITQAARNQETASALRSRIEECEKAEKEPLPIADLSALEAEIAALEKEEPEPADFRESEAAIESAKAQMDEAAAVFGVAGESELKRLAAILPDLKTKARMLQAHKCPTCNQEVDGKLFMPGLPATLDEIECEIAKHDALKSLNDAVFRASESHLAAKVKLTEAQKEAERIQEAYQNSLKALRDKLESERRHERTREQEHKARVEEAKKRRLEYEAKLNSVDLGFDIAAAEQMEKHLADELALVNEKLQTISREEGVLAQRQRAQKELEKTRADQSYALLIKEALSPKGVVGTMLLEQGSGLPDKLATVAYTLSGERYRMDIALEDGRGNPTCDLALRNGNQTIAFSAASDSQQLLMLTALAIATADPSQPRILALDRFEAFDGDMMRSFATGLEKLIADGMLDCALLAMVDGGELEIAHKAKEAQADV